MRGTIGQRFCSFAQRLAQQDIRDFLFFVLLFIFFSELPIGWLAGWLAGW